MPITATRLEKRIYHAKISGEFTEEALAQAHQEQLEFVARYGDHDYVVIAELVGKWKAIRSNKALQMMVRDLQETRLLILLGWTPALQILGKAVFITFGIRHKIAFADTMEDALVKARAQVNEQQGSS